MTTILHRPYIQKIELLKVVQVKDNVFDAYRMEFSLSPNCYIVCTIDFGTDGNLRVYDIAGRQTPEGLAIFSQFISNEEWLKEAIELKVR